MRPTRSRTSFSCSMEKVLMTQVTFSHDTNPLINSNATSRDVEYSLETVKRFCNSIYPTANKYRNVTATQTTDEVVLVRIGGHLTRHDTLKFTGVNAVHVAVVHAVHVVHRVSLNFCEADRTWDHGNVTGAFSFAPDDHLISKSFVTRQTKRFS